MSEYIQLGATPLELITWVDSFQGQYGWHYAQHDLIERKAHLQWVGDELETRSLFVKLHAVYCNPMTEFYKIKTAADTHWAHLLIFANGRIEGWFVVVSVNRVLTFTDEVGNVISMELQIELKEYKPAPRQPSAGGGVAAGSGIGVGGLGGASALLQIPNTTSQLTQLPPGLFNGPVAAMALPDAAGANAILTPSGFAPFVPQSAADANSVQAALISSGLTLDPPAPAAWTGTPNLASGWPGPTLTASPDDAASTGAQAGNTSLWAMLQTISIGPRPNAANPIDLASAPSGPVGLWPYIHPIAYDQPGGGVSGSILGAAGNLGLVTTSSTLGTYNAAIQAALANNPEPGDAAASMPGPQIVRQAVMH